MASVLPRERPHSANARRIFGQFATGVMVLATATSADRVHGMTVSACTSLSLRPLLVLTCVAKTAGMHDLIRKSGGFALTTLAADQTREMRHFASPRRPSGVAQFEGIAWAPAPVTGAPVLKGGLAYVNCSVESILPGGDHSIVVGEILDMGRLEGEEPLIFYQGKTRRLAGTASPAGTEGSDQ